MFAIEKNAMSTSEQALSDFPYEGLSPIRFDGGKNAVGDCSRAIAGLSVRILIDHVDIFRALRQRSQVDYVVAWQNLADKDNPDNK